MVHSILACRKSKHLWAYSEGEAFEPDEQLAAEQRGLFFLGNPEWIVTMAQFTQLGYAISFSVVVTFWNDMEKDDFASPHWYLWPSLICYSVFVYCLARVIPRFTLCSNLGQLVDKALLNESLAAYKLKEAEHHRARKEYHDYDSMSDFGLVDGMSDQIVVVKSFDNDSDGTSPSATDNTIASTNASTSSPPSSTTDLVQMDTTALRQATIQLRAERRKKAQSEGVALMRAVTIQEEPGNADDQFDVSMGISAKRRHQRKRSLSGGVDLMQRPRGVSFSEPERAKEQLLSSYITMDTKALKMAVSSMGNNDSHRSLTSRNRSNSDGVAAMALAGGFPEHSRSSRTTQVSDDSAILQTCQGEDSSRQSRSSRRKQKSASLEMFQQMLQTVLSKDQKDDDDDDDDNNSLALSHVDSVKRSSDRHGEDIWRLSLHERICDYFTGPSFRLASHVLGTMCCFFFVAMRVEGFQKKQCNIPEDDLSWDLPLQLSFLVVTVWLSVALGVSTAVLCIFAAKERLNRKDWKAVVAAILDIAVVGTCLGLFLCAESQRCCMSDSYSGFSYEEGEAADLYFNNRFLQVLQDYNDGEKGVCRDETLECTCPAFGFRISGGLGSIEPWTALIALQAFRFLVAGKIAQIFHLGEKNHVKEHSDDDHSHGHSHGHGHFGPEVIADAWQRTVAKHPELVEKYGEFSGEILQAMMGLDIIEGRPRSSTLQHDGVPEKKRGNRIELKDDRYNGLAPEAQEIVVAGIVGKPVKSSCRNLASLLAPLEFEIDTQKNEVEMLPLSMTLQFPNARIIRSVRRCDRMYLPLLKTWAAVDVILTDHEMVYVDIKDPDGSTVDLTRAKACREALVATKGGKGLRLCDIAGSRRIVGHLSLTDITAVYVDREMPHAMASRDSKDRERQGRTVDVDMEEMKIMKPTELWQAGGDGHFVSSKLADRWDVVLQDRLKIETRFGTLYLRFYADLVDHETHPERNVEAVGGDSPLYKDVAFQWAQTLVHISVHQLKQELPHFGNNDNSELRDYLRMVSV
jgi:hypothetical protein